MNVHWIADKPRHVTVAVCFAIESVPALPSKFQFQHCIIVTGLKRAATPDLVLQNNAATVPAKIPLWVLVNLAAGPSDIDSVNIVATAPSGVKIQYPGGTTSAVISKIYAGSSEVQYEFDKLMA